MMPDLLVRTIKDVAGRKALTRSEERGRGSRWGVQSGVVIEPTVSAGGVELFRAGIHGFDVQNWVLWPG